MDNALTKVASAVNQDPVILEADVLPSNKLHGLLQKWKIMPLKKRLVIRPATLGTLVRISDHLLSIDMSVFNTGNVMEGNFKAIAKHGRAIATIVAIAVQNMKDKPSESLVDFIYRHFTTKDLLNAMSLVLRQMDVTSFTATIISIRGMNVLEKSEKPKQKPEEMSPIEQGS